jgi:hypothetical protein
MAAPLLFSDEYDGPRWTYGLTYRPLSTATVPKGWLIDFAKPVPNAGFAFGTVDYPRELTPEEVRAFELTLVSATEEA